MKKAQQRLYFLRTLGKNHISTTLLKTFYQCSIESVLTYSILAWYGNCSEADRAALQRVVNTTQKNIGLPLPPLKNIYRLCCYSKACRIISDDTHPLHHIFTLLPSGRCYKALKCRTTRLRHSFYPSVVKELNSLTPILLPPLPPFGKSFY